LNRFVGMVYPSFTTTTQRMVGPFLRLTLGDMFSRVPGFISGLTISVDTNTPWEINLFNESHLAKLPHVVTCAVTYTIIGDEQLVGDTTSFYTQTKMKQEDWKMRSWYPSERGDVGPAIPGGISKFTAPTPSEIPLVVGPLPIHYGGG